MDMNFVICDELIYHKKRQRLCISISVDKNIFKLAHENNEYFEINRCYSRIFESLYVLHLSKKLPQYVTHCFNCY